MNKRGIIILSTLFGLFALSFGVLGVRALTLGPDPARPTDAQLAARTVAANQLERKIQAARANTPPALPAVPDRVQVSASTGGAAGSNRSGGASAAAPVQATPPTTQARGGEYYDEGEEYGDDGDDYETERGDDRGYGGDNEDD